MTTNYLTFMSNKLREHELQLKGRELGIRQEELSETQRHQQAVEGETARHNLQDEEYERQRRTEEERHNKEVERLSGKGQWVSAGSSTLGTLISSGGKIGSTLLSGNNKSGKKASDDDINTFWSVPAGAAAKAAAPKAAAAAAAGATGSGAIGAGLPVFMPLEVITKIVDPSGVLFRTRNGNDQAEKDPIFDPRMN